MCGCGRCVIDCSLCWGTSCASRLPGTRHVYACVGVVGTCERPPPSACSLCCRCRRRRRPLILAAAAFDTWGLLGSSPEGASALQQSKGSKCDTADGAYSPSTKLFVGNIGEGCMPKVSLVSAFGGWDGRESRVGFMGMCQGSKGTADVRAMGADDAPFNPPACMPAPLGALEQVSG